MTPPKPDNADSSKPKNKSDIYVIPSKRSASRDLRSNKSARSPRAKGAGNMVPIPTAKILRLRYAPLRMTNLSERPCYPPRFNPCLSGQTMVK